MGTGAEPGTRSPPRRGLRRRWIVLLGLVVAGLVVFAISRLNLSRAGHALITARPGWIALAFVFMGSSLLLRSVSWHQVLKAALPGTAIPWAPVIRALMIGVMASAVFPGRIGEPTRVVVITRHLEGPRGRLLAVVAGTVFSQTLINLLALAILAAITFTGGPLFNGSTFGIATAIAVPLAIAMIVVFGPRALATARRARSERLRRLAASAARLLSLARQGMFVFTRFRYGAGAISAQLLAWALQWLACYMIVLALGLQSQATLVTAAAVLLAVNVSAVLPATPSNVGVFQAACLVVLAAYGVGAGPGLAYGIILQAVEVITALVLGVPALLGEGLRWRDIRAPTRAAEEEIDAAARSSADEDIRAPARGSTDEGSQ